MHFYSMHFSHKVKKTMTILLHFYIVWFYVLDIHIICCCLCSIMLLCLHLVNKQRKWNTIFLFSIFKRLLFYSLYAFSLYEPHTISFIILSKICSCSWMFERKSFCLRLCVTLPHFCIYIRAFYLFFFSFPLLALLYPFFCAVYFP